jgi:hypothetical protein
MLGRDTAMGLVRADELLKDAADHVGRHLAHEVVQDQLLVVKREKFDNARCQV